MCSTSKVNDMLGLQGGGNGATKAPTVASCKLKHSRHLFFLVDVREAQEITESPLSVTADASIPLGQLIFDCMRGKLDEWKTMDKTILLTCASGYRAEIAASQLAKAGFTNVASLSRGMIGLSSPAATVPDFLVVLATKTDAEKLTLALNACAVAASSGQTVVLALMGDGVCTFLRKGSNKEVSEGSFRVEETFIGEPFKPAKDLLTKLLTSGNGVVLACSSCAKSRKIEFGSDMLDCVQAMQMPDLLRMLEEAKKSLQFM